MKRIASLLLAVIMFLGMGIYVPTETLAADAACYLTVDYGAAVKVTDATTTGLRWTARINKQALEADGYTIVEKGFIIAPTAYVTGEWAVLGGETVKAKTIADDFTQEALTAAGLDCIDIKVDGFTDIAETEFSALIQSLKTENFSLNYSARAYLDVKDSNGTNKRIYSSFEEDKDGNSVDEYAVAVNARSPGYVAKKALADTQSTRDGKYFFKVEGKEEYSPYNPAQREILAGFILEDPEKPANVEGFTYPTYDNADEYADMRAKLETWVREQLEGKNSIFSLDLQTVKGLGGYNPSTTNGSEYSYDLLSNRWTASDIIETTVNGNKVLTKTYTDNGVFSSLKFTTTVTLYGDVPTADIKTVIENTSTSKRSPVIKNFYAIDSSFELAEADGNITLKTLKGSNASDSDFNMVEKTLTANESDNTFAPTGTHAFSSNGDGFPYFDLIGEDKGLMMAIGWSGKWESSFAKDSNGNALIKAKQQNLSTYLNALDRIEAPRIVLTYFDGDYEYGHNIWRESVLSHYTPDDDNDESNGNNLKAPISVNFFGGTYAETIKTCVNNLVEKGAAIDIVWMDAGWYGNLLFSKDQSSGNAAAFNTNTPADKEKWETYIAQNPTKTFNKSSTNAPDTTGDAVWVEFMGNYVENSFLFPGERGIGQIGDFVDNMNDTKGTDLKFMLWWMIFDRRSSHKNYYYPDESGAATEDLVEAAGDTPLQLLTQEEIDEYGSKYPGLKNLEVSDYMSGGSRLNISDDDVLETLIAYYSYMMNEKGVDAIRLDNSYIALSMWFKVDIELLKSEAGITAYIKEDGTASDNLYRKGYTENKSITNEYKLWDTLKEINPNFFLDNTASGGRRLDIELVKRGVALWRTDLNGSNLSATDTFYEQHQEQTQNISLWIPLTSAGYVIDTGTAPTVYQARSLYSAAACVDGPRTFDITATYADGRNKIDHAVKMTNEFAALRPYWYGNYYQLLEVSEDVKNTWQSYQLYREDLNEGMFVVIRQRETDTNTQTVHLKGLKNCAQYTIVDIDDNTESIYTGAELMNDGYTVETTSAGTIKTYKIILVD